MNLKSDKQKYIYMFRCCNDQNDQGYQYYYVLKMFKKYWDIQIIPSFILKPIQFVNKHL